MVCDFNYLISYEEGKCWSNKIKFAALNSSFLVVNNNNDSGKRQGFPSSGLNPGLEYSNTNLTQTDPNLT
jgi:hypothetical protein